MTADDQVFLDANALIYALDESSEWYGNTVKLIQKLLDDGVTLCTSHHVIEEVLHVARKIGSTTMSSVVAEIGKLPDLVLVEPDAVLDFEVRYAKLGDRLKMGVNDALLLQLMLDAGIEYLLSYDNQLVNRAQGMGLQSVI